MQVGTGINVFDQMAIMTIFGAGLDWLVGGGVMVHVGVSAQQYSGPINGVHVFVLCCLTCVAMGWAGRRGSTIVILHPFRIQMNEWKGLCGRQHLRGRRGLPRHRRAHARQRHHLQRVWGGAFMLVCLPA